eukprot:5389354-Prymnesium_polylepis.1
MNDPLLQAWLAMAGPLELSSLTPRRLFEENPHSFLAQAGNVAYFAMQLAGRNRCVLLKNSEFRVPCENKL